MKLHLHDRVQAVIFAYRPLPLNRRAPIGQARLPVPGREAGTEPLAPARQVAACDPALHIVLVFLSIAAFVAVVIAWFAILFTGRYPRGLFDFVLGVLRWGNRVIGYAFVLVTDQYPPFRLSS
jgi:hypothetical protein